MIAVKNTNALFAIQISKQQWMKSVLYVGLALMLMLLCQHVFASDGTEFADATNKLESWAKGHLGKLAALGTLIIGLFYAGWKKDWAALIGPVILAVSVGIIVGIVNASFTATI